MIYGLGTVWRCDCCGEYHTLLIIDDYPRVIVLIDGVEVLTLKITPDFLRTFGFRV